MRRLISILLLLTLSLGSLAWATDSHEEALLGQAACTCTMHDGTLPAGADHGCDHCCHGAAHLLAVLPAGPELAVPARNVRHLRATAVLYSRAAPPLLQPPRRSV